MIALAPELPVMPPVQSEDDRIDHLVRTISASRLSTFLQCRLKFYFQYVLKVERQKSSSLHVGSTVHEVLKHWNKARWRGVVIAEDQFQSIFDDAWAHPENDEQVNWQSEEEEQEKKAQAWKLVLTYFGNTPLNAAIKPEGVEVYAQADLAEHGLPMLTGVLDLVQEEKVIDFKTSKTTPNEQTAQHQHEIQATAYSMLYREAVGTPEKGVEFHHLVKLKSPKLVVTEMPPMTEEKKTRLLHQIESYTEGLSRKDFVPSPGLMCCQCSYLSECRRWS